MFQSTIGGNNSYAKTEWDGFLAVDKRERKFLLPKQALLDALLAFIFVFRSTMTDFYNVSRKTIVFSLPQRVVQNEG